ncbi:PQQ-dependent sugar dehydrogenase [Solirubrobacter deserti]|uniref:PQQ-dependent sugar dehydrogenase n=1 Tax=Solirubrobacter deserti TaxID=2282478 RepID=A0ABT4RLI1_9ACTN|nr:PQQ-dependent sugar dehydrogenase [Solirubrobacter deserti]MDA0139191.1 PQQ-dependent sugar dehydrogenase [Solirubrobacter deserti]
MFVVEKAGRVKVGAATFLDVSAEVADGSEQGLLSMAFAPDYATSGRFFVFLTVAGGGDFQVREYRRASADAADPASARVLLSIPRPAGATNHNGGQLQFGPDGLLWVATGDGGNTPLAAQDPASLLGKIIKLDVNSGTPAIAASGLRNPWRFSFDRATGQIVIADVGNAAREEVNVGLAANYGWPCREGTLTTGTSDPRCDTGSAAPALEQDRNTSAFRSITGGYVVRDPGLPTLVGRYLYGDFVSPELRSFDITNPASDAPVGLEVPQLSSFGEDMCGRLFVVSLSGPVYRLVDGAPSACPAPPVPPAPPAPPAVTPDTRACTIRASASGTRSVRRLKRFSLSLRTNETCRVRVRASIKGVAQFRSTTVDVAAGKRSVARVRLTSRGLRKVRAALRRNQSLRVALWVSAVDAAGNTRTQSRTVRIRG